MNSLDRCQAVIHHRIPDRVPTEVHNFLSAIHYAGFLMAQAFQNGELLAEAQMKFWKDFGQGMFPG